MKTNQNILKKLVELETKRQNDGLEMIASENFASKKVRELCGSVLTNKYAEGFPGKRYYGGCEHIDNIEQLAIDLACKLFKCKFANVQPHSGSSANMIAYAALLKPGDKIMSLGLNEGGHLTHGSPVSFSGKNYAIIHYGLNEKGRIDYEQLEKLAHQHKPNLILAGFSSYPYEVDFARIGKIAKGNDAIFLVDMAHISGLIATGYHQNPFPHADVVTSTTHKTLRGPRGGIILTNEEHINKKINSMCFPGMQGGPLEHIIAGKAQCFIEALDSSFKTYIHDVLENTKACAEQLLKRGAITSGTETHLFYVDTKKSFNMTGLDAQDRLETIGITVNKNMIPNDEEKPFIASGIRVGMAALTTRGLTEDGARKIADLMYDFLMENISKTQAYVICQEIVKQLKPIELI
jgi:glycine hydroxymethyltransferase